MRQPILSAFKSCGKLATFLIVLVISACVSLRPMPKLTRGMTNPAKSQVDAINSFGTEFHFKFSDKNDDGSYMFDKWICAPGDQVIDLAAWMQELLVVIKQGSK